MPSTRQRSSLSLSFLAVILSMTGCVHHLTKQECIKTDWRQAGYMDGKEGRERNIQRNVSDCEKFHIKVNTALYNTGWKEGAKLYCTPDFNKGFSVGQTGAPAASINQEIGRFCQFARTPVVLTQFKKGYHQGIATFCTYQKGHDYGAVGNALPQVCPKDLASKYQAGWEAGRREYCANDATAFSLGKMGKAFPQACQSQHFAAFRKEFNRGAVVYRRVAALQSQVKNIDASIKSKIDTYHLASVDGQTYMLGDIRTPEADYALRQANALLQKRESVVEHLEDEQAQV